MVSASVGVIALTVGILNAGSRAVGIRRSSSWKRPPNLAWKSVLCPISSRRASARLSAWVSTIRTQVTSLGYKLDERL